MLEPYGGVFVRLRDKVALVTGAGSGIGKATAILFGKEGAKVSASDLNEHPAKETAHSIKDTGGEAIFLTGDVAEMEDVERNIKATIETYGRLDILVNSAGINDRQLPETWRHDQVWDRVMEVNLKGTYLTCWYAVPEMLRSGSGSIINLSSVMGLVGSEYTGADGFSAYVPSKGGVVQLTRNLALEHAKNGIRVNCICPGYINTNLTERLRDNQELRDKITARHPVGRFGEAEEIAYAALFLASDESSFVTGIALPVDGGYTAQ